MSSLPIIVLTQRIVYESDISETRDAIDHRFIDWVLNIGGSPHLIPNNLGSFLIQWLDNIKPSAFLLSSGNDIGEFLERDRTEIGIINYAKKKSIPLLGICRGAQIMGYHEGVNLVPVKKHVRTSHSLIGDEVMKGLLPKEVNSFHNFGMLECPIGYELLATSSDGVVEAFKHKTLPWEAWMWHPEREEPFHDLDLNRAKNLLLKGQVS
jgi:putative glutamine amidotransferase